LALCGGLLGLLLAATCIAAAWRGSPVPAAFRAGCAVPGSPVPPLYGGWSGPPPLPGGFVFVFFVFFVFFGFFGIVVYSFVSSVVVILNVEPVEPANGLGLLTSSVRRRK